MNKNDLIASVASSAGLSKSDATRAIESFLDAITNALKRDEKVMRFLTVSLDKNALQYAEKRRKRINESKKNDK